MTATPAALTTTPRLYLPQRRLFDRREFQQILDSGVFGPEERFELINGEIVAKELPMKAAHATAQQKSEAVMRQVFAGEFVVRGQLPLALGQHAEPLPDIAVVVGARRDYEKEHPTTALLVMEIADITLRYDRTTKAGLYASVRIADYWILNLTKRRLEVYRDPQPLRGAPLGHHYASRTFYGETASVTPLAAPQSLIAVRDLLPRP